MLLNERQITKLPNLKQILLTVGSDDDGWVISVNVLKFGFIPVSLGYIRIPGADLVSTFETGFNCLNEQMQPIINAFLPAKTMDEVKSILANLREQHGSAWEETHNPVLSDKDLSKAYNSMAHNMMLVFYDYLGREYKNRYDASVATLLSAAVTNRIFISEDQDLHKDIIKSGAVDKEIMQLRQYYKLKTLYTYFIVISINVQLQINKDKTLIADYAGWIMGKAENIGLLDMDYALRIRLLPSERNIVEANILINDFAKLLR